MHYHYSSQGRARICILWNMYANKQIPNRSFCVLLHKKEELNSWILKLGKASLVVTQTGVRHLQTSLYEQHKQPSNV